MTRTLVALWALMLTVGSLAAQNTDPKRDDACIRMTGVARSEVKADTAILFLAVRSSASGRGRSARAEPGEGQRD